MTARHRWWARMTQIINLNHRSWAWPCSVGNKNPHLGLIPKMCFTVRNWVRLRFNLNYKKQKLPENYNWKVFGIENRLHLVLCYPFTEHNQLFELQLHFWALYKVVNVSYKKRKKTKPQSTFRFLRSRDATTLWAHRFTPLPFFYTRLS